MMTNLNNFFLDWSMRSFDIAAESQTIKKLQKFMTFQDGWSVNGGVKFQNDVIEEATKLINFGNSLSFYENDAFPGESGEILITFYKDEYCAEVIIEPNLSYEFLLEKGDHELKDISVNSFEKVKELLLDFRDETCSISEYSPINIGTKDEIDSVVWPSNPQVATAEYPLLSVPALISQVIANARILENSTPEFHPSHTYSGDSTLMPYLPCH